MTPETRIILTTLATKFVRWAVFGFLLVRLALVTDSSPVTLISLAVVSWFAGVGLATADHQTNVAAGEALLELQRARESKGSGR